MMERYLTPQEVADHLVIPVARVSNWLRAGRLQGIKVGKVWRISESALQSFLATPTRVAVNE